MTQIFDQLVDDSAGGVAQQLVTLIRRRFPLALAVYAFGSQVQGSADAQSDLDLAVLVAGYADPLALWDMSGHLADIAATGRIYAR